MYVARVGGDGKPASRLTRSCDLFGAATTAEELKALPGIGDAYSRKSIDIRPYKRKDELVHNKILPQATYDEVRDQLIAKQSPAKK